MGKKIEPPCEDDIRSTLAGDRDSRNRIVSHYQRLICYMLHKEIDRATIATGFAEELFQFDDLLHDNIVLLENAILTFKDY